MQFETATLIKLLAALMAFMLKIRWGCKKLINKAAVIDE
jgi:type III secretory pathway component EscS